MHFAFTCRNSWLCLEYISFLYIFCFLFTWKIGMLNKNYPFFSFFTWSLHSLHNQSVKFLINQVIMRVNYFSFFWCLFLVHRESRWLAVMVLWSSFCSPLVQERKTRRKVLAARIPQAKSTSRRVSHSTWGKQAECSSSLSFITWESLMADGVRVHNSPVGQEKEEKLLIVL